MALSKLFSQRTTLRLLVGACLLASHSIAVCGDDLVTSQMVDEARMWQSKGRIDLASNMWRRILVTNPQHIEALTGLGIVEARAGRLSEAQSLYQRAKKSGKTTPNLTRLAVMLESTSASVESSSATNRQSPAQSTRASEPPNTTVPDGKTTTSSSQKSTNTPKSGNLSSPKDPAIRSVQNVKKVEANSAALPQPLPVAPPSTEVRVTALPFPPISATRIGGASSSNDDVELGLKTTDTLKSAALAPSTSITAVAISPSNNLRRPKPCRLPVSGATAVTN